MHRKPELALRGLTEGLGMGKATPRELLWHAEWASPVATAMAIENQTPKRGWGLR